MDQDDKRSARIAVYMQICADSRLMDFHDLDWTPMDGYEDMSEAEQGAAIDAMYRQFMYL